MVYIYIIVTSTNIYYGYAGLEKGQPNSIVLGRVTSYNAFSQCLVSKAGKAIQPYLGSPNSMQHHLSRGTSSMAMVVEPPS